MEADAKRLAERLRCAPCGGTAPILPELLATELLDLLSATGEAATRQVAGRWSVFHLNGCATRGAPHDSPRARLETSSTQGVCLHCGTAPTPQAPQAPAVERGRSPRRRRLHGDYHHGSGSHGNTHGHVHDHGNEAGSDGEEEPHCEPIEDFSRVSHCDGASRVIQHDNASHGHVHGHTHECNSEPAQHEQLHTSCDDKTCCRSFGAKRQGAEVRLNAHCDFRGHCVQMKHTFLHIPCNDSDSDSDRGSCVVCRLTRSSSV